MSSSRRVRFLFSQFRIKNFSYGQTECSAAGTLTLINDTTCRHVGGPSPWAQVKLIDVPDLGYYSKENKGEVCFRGAAIMTRYFKEPELTAQTIDKDVNLNIKN